MGFLGGEGKGLGWSHPAHSPQLPDLKVFRICEEEGKVMRQKDKGEKKNKKNKKMGADEGIGWNSRRMLGDEGVTFSSPQTLSMTSFYRVDL